jgi:predicted transposase YbfD/YdcC
LKESFRGSKKYGFLIKRIECSKQHIFELTRNKNIVMSTLPAAQCSTFYETLQQCEGLDLRDKRGKVHAVELVLTGVFIGLCRNRDGVLSAIHRCIQNTHAQLCTHLGIANSAPISRAQLPLVLKSIDVQMFSELLFEFCGIKLREGEKQWFAGDGKELRGSILKGEKRGEAVVQLVHHDSGQVYDQGFYNGHKESERPCLQQLLEGKIASQQITLDALHLIPETVKKIAGQQGIYVAGLKDNQEHLYADMTTVCRHQQPLSSFTEVEKGHGRIDKRTYRSYDIAQQYFDDRWTDAHFRTLVEVERQSVQLNIGMESKEVSYYLSNAPVKDKENQELFKAVRKHWSIEVSNHIRDVTFKEDHLKTKESRISQTMACCRTILLNLLRKLDLDNIKAKLDAFADNLQMLLNWMTQIKLL